MKLGFIRTTSVRCTNWYCICAFEEILRHLANRFQLHCCCYKSRKIWSYADKNVQNAAVIGFSSEVDCNDWNLVNIFQPAQFLFDLCHKATRTCPSLKWLDIGNAVKSQPLKSHAIPGYVPSGTTSFNCKCCTLRTLDFATFSNGFRVGQSGMMSARLPRLDPGPRVSISRIAFSKIFVWARLPLRELDPKKAFSEMTSSNFFGFARLPRRIVDPEICKFSKKIGFCAFSAAAGIVKVGSARLTFLLAGSWIMFRNEMNISRDLHNAPQLHLSTMYNEEDIKPRYMYRNIWMILDMIGWNIKVVFMDMPLKNSSWK